jgi:hypothetical protein
VSVQGVVLIAAAGAIGYAAWRGLENIPTAPTRWTWVSLALIAATLLFAALAIRPGDGGLASDSPASSSACRRARGDPFIACAAPAARGRCATGCGNPGAS